MNKQELFDAILSGQLWEAHYQSKWYGSYYTQLSIFHHDDTNELIIRKDDVGSLGLIRTHWVKCTFDKQEAINILKKTREATYHVVEFALYDDSNI